MRERRVVLRAVHGQVNQISQLKRVEALQIELSDRLRPGQTLRHEHGVARSVVNVTHPDPAVADAFAPYNIRVNCAAPGLTNTELARVISPDQVERFIAMTPMGRMAEPSEIAGVVKFLLSEDSSFVTGQTVPACGGRY